MPFACSVLLRRCIPNLLGIFILPPRLTSGRLVCLSCSGKAFSRETALAGGRSALFPRARGQGGVLRAQVWYYGMDELSSACTKLGDQTTPKPLRLVNQERRCSKDRMLQPSSPPVTAAPGTPEGTRPGNNCPPSSGQRLRPQPHRGAPAGDSGQGSAGHGREPRGTAKPWLP